MIQAMLRITLAAVVLATGGALVEGCGGGNSGSSSATGAITKAQVIGYAHAVNLQAADGLGRLAGPREHEVNETGFEAKIGRCLGGRDSRDEIRVESAYLRYGRAQVTSSVVVALRPIPNPATREARYLALVTTRGQACAATYYAQQFRQHGLRQVVASSQHNPLLELPNLGATRTLVTTARFAFYLDTFLFFSGRALIELGITAVSRPLSLTSERHLLSLLYSRAKAHTL